MESLGTRTADLIYGRKVGLALTMDMWRPPHPNGAAVIWFVSGGWSSDPAFLNPGFMDPAWFQHFTSRGYTLFLVCHGSRPHFALSDILLDIHRASRFIRFNSQELGIDPDRLGASGMSSGGHLALSLGVGGAPGSPDAADPVDRTTSAVAAVACFYPPTDFLNYGEPGKSFLEHSQVSDIIGVFGNLEGSQSRRDAVLRAFSPIYSITSHSAPTLIVHGDADEIVPIEQSERFIDRHNNLAVPGKLEVRPGLSHGWPEIADDFACLADWFDRHLS